MNSSRKVSHKKVKKAKKTNFKRRFKKRISKNLQHYLRWQHSTAKFIASITCGLMKAHGVWLKRICQATDDESITIRSQVKKLERFLQDQYIDYHLLSSMIHRMLNIKGKVTLIIDRTNWDFGKKHINILVIALEYTTPDGKRFAIPVAWEVFSKKGNSNTQERIDLIKKVIAIVGRENIETTLGDREFVGETWMKFLTDEFVPFILRIKSNMYVTYNGKRIQAGTLAASLKPNEKLDVKVILNGISMRLAATKTKDGELVIVVASHNVAGDLLNAYRLRWIIELFFKSIKSNGFRLEDTHITDPLKIKKLFALIAIATLHVVQAGVVRHVLVKKIPIKNHGRPAYSLFTYGLDFLRALFAGDTSIAPRICDLLAPPPEYHANRTSVPDPLTTKTTILLY